MAWTVLQAGTRTSLGNLRSNRSLSLRAPQVGFSRRILTIMDLWVNKDFSKYPQLSPIGDQFAFVQARAADNLHLPASYLEKLNTLPDHMRKAYAEGDWECSQGNSSTCGTSASK